MKEKDFLVYDVLILVLMDNQNTFKKAKAWAIAILS